MKKPITTAEIRDAYLKFFEEKGCQIWPSSSLVPDDPSLLLTVAGMVQFKPYFLQQKKLDDKYVGTTTTQRCVRTNDIDIIGTDGRHLSFFEMLGNFSFGKYFKREMCAWAWEFSTEVLQLEKDRIYVTVFTDDDEAAQIWEETGVDKSHISRLGEDDNFWTAGATGPCGPCSEMYYDQGKEYGCGSPDCKPGCDCDRFLEYWNLVFTQFDQQEDGSRIPLEKKNIDTGMGLERVAAIMQGVQSNFDTDVLAALVDLGKQLSSLTPKELEEEQNQVSLKIIADHARAIIFMIGDGILPSNEGRGYILRRLIRRSALHGKRLGFQTPFLESYIPKIIELMGKNFPQIKENYSLIQKTLDTEESRFNRTLAHGQKYLNDKLGTLDGKNLSGKDAFTLHDTYGFPLELTQEICNEAQVTVDVESFNKLMEDQKQRARNAREDNAWEEDDNIIESLVNKHPKTEFCGYNNYDTQVRVLDIVQENQVVESA
ncbi:MAG: alanine--tRNA ligase, partial [Coriobacteriales bacterium]|nr:alanine--tRNA ligase [Coriobacteriales bacterium]